MLFYRLTVKDPTTQGGKLISIVGGAGGVGSIAIQLLRALTDVTMTATAFCTETQEWVKEFGAQCVVDHSNPMKPQIKELSLRAPGFVFCTIHMEHNSPDIVELMAPQGRFGLIDNAFKKKSMSLHLELMFTRQLFETPDMEGKLNCSMKWLTLWMKAKFDQLRRTVQGRLMLQLYSK